MPRKKTTPPVATAKPKSAVITDEKQAIAAGQATAKQMCEQIHPKMLSFAIGALRKTLAEELAVRDKSISESRVYNEASLMVIHGNVGDIKL
ncbi:MAG TPA: hypothetical protein PLB89_05355 [Flavobacteriales bacterium]|nr:hypothetical protein [Flavobacteriales bacterium]